VQAAAELVTNQFTTTVSLARPSEISSGVTGQIQFSIIVRHDWTVQLGKEIYGLFQSEEDGSTLVFASRAMNVPFSAPTIAWTCGGLSVLLILLSLALAARWRRRKQKGAE
jgi:hypothetical protein